MTTMPKAVYGLLGFRLFASIVSGLGFYLSLYLSASLAMSLTHIGLLLSCYGLGTFLGGISGGAAADRWPAAVVSVVALAFEGTSFCLVALVKASVLLFPILFVFGFAGFSFIASNNLSILNVASQTSTPEQSRLSAINLVSVANNIGVGSAGILMSALHAAILPVLFKIAGALLVAAALVYCFMISKIQINVLAPLSQSDQDQAQHQPNRYLLVLTLITVFAIGWVVAQHRTTYAPFLHDAFGANGFFVVGLVFAINPICIILFQNLFVNWLGRFNSVKVIIFGMLLYALSCAILVDLTQMSIALISCLLFTVGEMMYFSPAQLLCYNYSNPKRKGTALGAFKSIYSASTLLGPLSGGLIYHNYGANALWLFTAGLVAIVALGYFILNVGAQFLRPQ